MESEVYNPSRCEWVLPNDLQANNLVAEEKFDGSRYVLYMGINPYLKTSKTALLSRRKSSINDQYVDKAANVPQITNCNWAEFVGTVFDGEIYCLKKPKDKVFLYINSIMNSGPEKAIQKQAEDENLVYMVFDILSFKGKTVKGRPYKERRKLLEHIIKSLNVESIKLVESWELSKEGEAARLFQKITEEKGEGLIIKDIDAAYGCKWAKMKKSYDVSCIVTGKKEGNGKFENSFGSLALSVLNEKRELIEVGHCSGFSDELREEINRNFEKYNGKVVDVFAQEIQKISNTNPCGRLRHATFHRFRDDVSAETITSEKLQEDLKSRVKFRRSK